MAKSERLAVKLQREQRVIAKSEQAERNRVHVRAGILSDSKMRDLAKGFSQQADFVSVMKTTLGRDFGSSGMLRALTLDDLRAIDSKISQLEGKYHGGIKPSQIINSSLPIDRQRASREIGWAHAVAGRFNPTTKTLIVSFVTAASGKNGASKHFVSVEFLEFNRITGHRLMFEADKTQAQKDLQSLRDSLIKFDCDCGRHTFWYRFIASKGQFAYTGKNPEGREETGFPKIRNPQLKGIACKHMLRVANTILNDSGFRTFMLKTIMKHYQIRLKQDDGKAKPAQQGYSVHTTKKEAERTIKQMGANTVAVLSTGERISVGKLFAKYRQASKQHLTRNHKDTKTVQQKLEVLAKVHNVEKLRHYVG